MKNILLSLIAITLLLSGCAKIETEGTPCSGPTLPPPSVPATVYLPSNTGTTVHATATAGASLIWTDPRGSVTTGNSVYLMEGATLGAYTVRARLGNCVSDPATFTVVDHLPTLYGAPPCQPFGTTGIFADASGTWLDYRYSYLSTSYSSGYGTYEIYGTDNTGSFLQIYLPVTSTPATGTYFVIDSNNTQGSGGTSATVTDYNYHAYTAVSGNIYVVSNGGQSSIAMCNVVFRYGATRKTIKGVCTFYP